MILICVGCTIIEQPEKTDWKEAFLDKQDELSERTIQYNELSDELHKLNKTNTKTEKNYIVIKEAYTSGKAQNEILYAKLEEYEELLEEYEMFEEVINLSHTIHDRYNYTKTFRCENFTSKYLEELPEGYDAYLMTGFRWDENGEKKRHAWAIVILNVDPTGGWVIFNQTKYTEECDAYKNMYSRCMDGEE